MASVTDRTPPVELLKLRQDLAGHVNEKSDLPWWRPLLKT